MSVETSSNHEPSSQTPSRLSFTLIRSRRRTLGLQVHADGQVQVRAPLDVSRREIERLVSSKAEWIDRKRREFAARPMIAEPRFVSGAIHFYLGRGYPLDLRQDAHESVSHDGERLVVCTPNTQDEDRVRVLLGRWYRAQATQILTERFDAALPIADRLGVARPHLMLRDMRRSWGNCRATGRITLNRRLVRTSISCIDYVIAHEMCHLVHLNHSKAYYRLLDGVCPDWRVRKAELDSLPN